MIEAATLLEFSGIVGIVGMGGMGGMAGMAGMAGVLRQLAMLLMGPGEWPHQKAPQRPQKEQNTIVFLR